MLTIKCSSYKLLSPVIPIIFFALGASASELNVRIFEHMVEKSQLESHSIYGTSQEKMLAGLTQTYAVEDFARRHNLEPSPDQIELALQNLPNIPTPSSSDIARSAERLNESLRQRGLPPGQASDAATEMLARSSDLQNQIRRFYVRGFILHWNVGREWFRKKGGPVIRSEFGHMLPVPGYVEYVEGALHRGEILISDSNLRTAFEKEISSPSSRGKALSNEEAEKYFAQAPWLVSSAKGSEEK